MWSNGGKIAFFSKNYKKAHSGWGFRPQTPVDDTFELQYTSVLNTSANLNTFTL